MVKLLFLPHCLVKKSIKRLEREGKEKGYEVYVVPGGSKVKKIIEEYSVDFIEKIVGVACGDEINLAKDYLNKINFERQKIFSVALSIDGCKNTKVSLEKVLEVL